MCGITGFWRSRPLDDTDERSLANMISTLVHRGPDGMHAHADPDRGLGMGHTRLSVIDLETGDQPIFAPERAQVLTMNGELYDYKETRARFVTEGARFTTKADSEIALHLYRKHGLEFVDHLRGEFAVALFDATRDRMVLVRDRFGIKPLYVRLQNDAVYWASEVKALLAHPDIEARLDRRAALHQLMQTMVPGSTSFEGIEAVLPGQMLVIDKEGDHFSIRKMRYWDADFPRDGEHAQISADDAVTGVRDRLLDAVRVRLEADVPVGAYLSGGIDSCSILGLASALQQSEVKAFTIGFHDAAYDETAIAAEMAEKTRADQVLIRLGADELYGDYYARTMWHAERTFYNTLGVAKFHMSRKVRACGYKVVVTGEGSDELFGGYPFFKRDLLLHATSAEEREAYMQRMEKSNAVFKGAILAEQSASHPAFDDLMGFTPSWIQPWILTLGEARGLLSAEVSAELEHYDPIAAIAETLDPAMMRGRHPLDRVQYSWIKTMLEGQILTWGGDRVDMANCMESRPAFLDHHLAEYAFTLHPHLRIRDGVEKWVLREAMKHVLPRVLYEREKFAFMAPPATVDARKAKAMRALAEKHLSRDAVQEAGLFDPKAVQDLVDGLDAPPDEQRSSAVRRDILLNHVMGVQMLHHQFVAGHGRPELNDGGPA